MEGITQMIQEFAAGFNSNDASRVAALFSGGGALMPPNASTLRGTESLETHYTRLFALGASDMELRQGAVSGVGPLAYVSGDYGLNFVPTEGESTRDRGKFVFIVRDFDGRWLVELLIFSSDFPPGTRPI